MSLRLETRVSNSISNSMSNSINITDDSGDEYYSNSDNESDNESNSESNNELDTNVKEVKKNTEDTIEDTLEDTTELSIFTIESPQYKQYKNKMLGSPTYINSRFSTYHIIGRERTNMFCKNIKPYGSNLQINKQHCKNIENQLDIEDIPLLCAEFIVVEYEEYKTNDKTTLIELYDGHHRRIALKQLLKRKPTFTIDIRVCVYKSDFPDSPESKKLFRNFNILKPFIVDFNDIEISMSIIDKLNDNFNKSNNSNLIKDTQTNVQRPLINKCKINNAIQERLNSLRLSNRINANDINIDSIISNFQRYNNKFSKKNLEWFNTNSQFTINKTTQQMIEKAKKMNCFIGLVNLKSLVKCCIGEEYN